MERDVQRNLLEAARRAMRFSYAPYSKFRVGAAVLTSRGRVITGCNVENASYGATVCAERVAIFNAIAQGESEIQAIAMVSEGGKICPPCGICLQVMHEFARDAEVLMVDAEDKILVRRVQELLPLGFGPEHF